MRDIVVVVVDSCRVVLGLGVLDNCWLGCGPRYRTEIRGSECWDADIITTVP